MKPLSENAIHPLFHRGAGEPATTVCFPAPVPYYAQVADAEHLADYLDFGKDLAQDPHWHDFGAETPAEYAVWATRACGIAAIKSAIEAFGGPCRSMQTWIQQALAIDGYRIDTDTNGQPQEIGWKHQALAELCQQAGIPAAPHKASLEDIAAAIRRGQLVIASVSYEIGTALPITRRGGHLVTITGVILEDETIAAAILHNPSGRRPDLRKNAAIPRQRFLAAFSGRVILIGAEKSTLHNHPDTSDLVP